MNNNTSSTYEVFQPNHTAVITGASSGIGKHAALECALKGMHVWLIDKDEPNLRQTKEMIKTKVGADTYIDQKIKAIVADVSDEMNMKFVKDTVMNDPTTTSVHFLMNNAAIAIGGNAIDTPMKEMDLMVKTNVYGCIHTCQQFIPTMKERGEVGLIVNTGSKQGITMPPGNLTYNMTKAALKTWTEGLEHELMMDRYNNGGKLKAALLIPGWTNTSIKLNELRDRARLRRDTKYCHDNMKKVVSCEENPADGAWMPKQVWDYMVERLDEGSFYIVCPDHEVDSFTDRCRMTWTMQDITEDRPPLSRWHPEWKSAFNSFLKAQEKK